MVLPTHFIDELKSHSALSFGATFDTVSASLASCYIQAVYLLQRAQLTLPEYTKIHAATRVILKLFIGKFNPSLGLCCPIVVLLDMQSLTCT